VKRSIEMTSRVPLPISEGSILLTAGDDSDDGGRCFTAMLGALLEPQRLDRVQLCGFACRVNSEENPDPRRNDERC
jgi:hypothetical protein